jgi:hypothetical protein
MDPFVPNNVMDIQNAQNKLGKHVKMSPSFLPVTDGEKEQSLKKLKTA